MERVKGIEPSYSAWKSPNPPNVFIVSSDNSQHFGRLRSLQNFSQSEFSEARYLNPACNDKWVSSILSNLLGVRNERIRLTPKCKGPPWQATPIAEQA
jgi:hypothetical protein